MRYSEAEDAGGLTPAKDDNAAVLHFNRRTLLFFGSVDYNSISGIVMEYASLQTAAKRGTLLSS